MLRCQLRAEGHAKYTCLLSSKRPCTTFHTSVTGSESGWPALHPLTLVRCRPPRLYSTQSLCLSSTHNRVDLLFVAVQGIALQRLMLMGSAVALSSTVVPLSGVDPPGVLAGSGSGSVGAQTAYALASWPSPPYELPPLSPAFSWRTGK